MHPRLVVFLAQGLGYAPGWRRLVRDASVGGSSYRSWQSPKASLLPSLAMMSTRRCRARMSAPNGMFSNLALGVSIENAMSTR